jgi:hypothetical protein
VAYKNAYGIDSECFRKWGFNYLLSGVVVGFIIIAIGTGTLQSLVKATELGQWLDDHNLSIDDQAKEEAAKRLARQGEAVLAKKVEAAKNEVMTARATEAAADLKVVSEKIREIELQGLKAPLSKEDMEELEQLKKQQLWDLGGRRELAPVTLAKPKPECSDGEDNNGDGYADEKDIVCWRQDPTCVTVDRACVKKCAADDKGCRKKCVKVDANCNNQFPQLDDGAPQAKWYRYHPELKEITPAAPKETEKTDDPQNPPSHQEHANGNGNGNGNGGEHEVAPATSVQKEFRKLLALKCARNPELCQKR